MGATPRQYWRYVALPILTPSILGTMILLFGNAFGAQATAFQLTGGTLNIVTLVISSQIRGDVLHNPGLGYAAGDGHGRDHGDLDRPVHDPPAALRAVAAVMSDTVSCSRATGRRDGIRDPGATRRAAAKLRLARGPGSSSSSALLYFFLPLIATFVHSIRTRPDIFLRLPPGPGRPEVLGRPALLVHGRRDHDHRQPADHRPDRLLGPPPGAAPAAGRRVRDADAVRHPARRPRLRADPGLSAAGRSSCRRRASAATCCSSPPT